jgi:putative ABC transport system permease protein
VAVRTATDPALTFPSLRSTVASIDPQIVVDGLQTMDTMISDTVAPERFNLVLVMVFAALAIFLAAVGVYGVLSYSISQRTREFGVRIALGAQTGGVLGIAIGEGMKLALLGILAGLAGGFILTRLMSSLLFGVTARDPITFAAVAVLVVLVSFTACFIPARRATHVDPIVALRYE